MPKSTQQVPGDTGCNTWPASLLPLFSFPPLSSPSIALPPPTPPSSLGCSIFSLPLPLLLPALPRPACRLTSPLLCSPIAAWAFFSRPLEPGEAPHPLFGQCFLLFPGPSQGSSWVGLAPSFYLLLSPKRVQNEGKTLNSQAGSVKSLLGLGLGLGGLKHEEPPKW